MSHKQPATPQTPPARANEDQADQRPPPQNVLYQLYVARLTGKEGPGDFALGEACLSRAQRLTSILTEYAWAGNVSGEELQFVFELLNDLLQVAYSTLTEED